MNGCKQTLNHAFLAASLLLLMLLGCIERTISINTEPEGATVVLNDQEVGKSPVRVPFTWYGDYDIVLRKPGHKTLQTSRRVVRPWYQYPIIDFFAECMVPFTIHDDHVINTFVLQPFEPPTKEELLGRAAQMRSDALDEPVGQAQPEG